MNATLSKAIIKKSGSAYINARVLAADGLKVADALRLLVAGKDKKIGPYAAKDLRYDIKQKLLFMHSPPPPNPNPPPTLPPNPHNSDTTPTLGTDQDTQDTTEDTDSPSQLDGSRKARKITRDLEEPPD
jgi:hypothetical protein